MGRLLSCTGAALCEYCPKLLALALGQQGGCISLDSIQLLRRAGHASPVEAAILLLVRACIAQVGDKGFVDLNTAEKDFFADELVVVMK